MTEIPGLVTLKKNSSVYFNKQPSYKIRLTIWSNLPKDIQEVRYKILAVGRDDLISHSQPKHFYDYFPFNTKIIIFLLTW